MPYLVLLFVLLAGQHIVPLLLCVVGRSFGPSALMGLYVPTCILYTGTMYMTEVPRVLHFSAFIDSLLLTVLRAREWRERKINCPVRFEYKIIYPFLTFSLCQMCAKEYKSSQGFSQHMQTKHPEYTGPVITNRYIQYTI